MKVHFCLITHTDYTSFCNSTGKFPFGELARTRTTLVFSHLTLGTRRRCRETSQQLLLSLRLSSPKVRGCSSTRCRHVELAVIKLGRGHADLIPVKPSSLYVTRGGNSQIPDFSEILHSCPWGGNTNEDLEITPRLSTFYYSSSRKSSFLFS